jgi:hypothetical protein
MKSVPAIAAAVTTANGVAKDKSKMIVTRR